LEPILVAVSASIRQSADPGFWDAGLDLVERQPQAAEEAVSA
jgi:hypothetical protein